MSTPKIVVLGGGFAGLETAFYLRMKMSEEADITLISDRDQFLYKPNTIYVPFGLDPEKLKIPLHKPTACKNIEFVQARAYEIDPDRKVVHLDGQVMSYDYLVVATGAGMRPAEIPGLTEHAQTIWTPNDMLTLRSNFRELCDLPAKKERRQVVFLVPPNNKCSGPLYEMVLMLDTWLRRQNVRDYVDIAWTTYEDSYIQAFGPRLHTVVDDEFERRNIMGHLQHVVQSVSEQDVVFQNGERMAHDLLITFPPYIASTPFPGLPSDERGFIKAEMATRQVIGHPDIYVVGDAGDFPIKQAFLAFLQSDAAAEHLSARILGTEPQGLFEPVSMCVMEEFDTATFAQVPLRVTGLAERPIEVDIESRDYKVGTSPTWRLGKMALSYYLPWRFNAGNPFHGGLPWKGMEMGLKAMSSVMAN